MSNRGFKCYQCGAIKTRPGSCNVCGKTNAPIGGNKIKPNVDMPQKGGKMGAHTMITNPTEQTDAIKRHHEGLMLQTLVVAPPTCEDRLRGAIIEALSFLDNNSPPKAHEVLKKALSIK